MINSIQRDNVGLLFDAWNWWVVGGDLDNLRTLRGADQAAAFLQAQTQFNPKPPFTTKDVDLWITLSKSSAKSCRWMFT